jgi:hypothetical protein
MREKIAGYLERAGRPLPAEQILREVLNIRSPNAFAADKVLRGILGGDARFHSKQGLWHFETMTLEPQPVEIAALIIQSSTSHTGSFRGAVHTSADDSSWEFLCTEGMKTPDTKPLQEARLRAENHLLLIWHAKELRLWDLMLSSVGLPPWHGETLVVSKLAARLLPKAFSCRHVEDLAPLLDLAPPDTDRPSSMAGFLEAVYRSLLDLVPAASRGSAAGLARWIEEGSIKVDFSRFAFGRELLAGIPASPGVYVMRNRAGEVIYVGKAGNLQRRVRSYFRARSLRDPKVSRIHSQLYILEFFTCATEVEALLMEARMIRDLHPAINLQEEVHEQPDRYGHEHNLLLLIPAGERIEVYFIKEGSFIARQSVPPGAAPKKSLCTKIKSIYFATRRRKLAASEDWETEIVARWLSAHRRNLNFIDVDETGSYDAVLRHLEAYLRDPDRLSHKVYYRLAPPHPKT